MSSTQDLQWLLTRKTSSYLVKQKGLSRIFSREPGNLGNIHSYKYGWVNDKAVAVEPTKSGRGITVTTKKTKVAPTKIAGSKNVQTISRGGSRRTAGAVANIVAKRGYRPDLLKAAVARSSAIHRSQNPKGRKQHQSRRARTQAARKPVVEGKE